MNGGFCGEKREKWQKMAIFVVWGVRREGGEVRGRGAEGGAVCMGERWCGIKVGEEEKVRAGDMFIRPVSPAHSPMLRIDPLAPRGGELF